MDPKTLRDKSFNSVKPELEDLEKQMSDAAGKGELRIVVNKLSPAAREYFKGKGFEVKIFIRPEGSDEQWSISWSNCK